MPKKIDTGFGIDGDKLAESKAEPEAKSIVGEEKITISKTDFDSLMRRVSSLESVQSDGGELPIYGGVEEDRVLETHVRLIDGRPIVDIKNVIDKGKDIQGNHVITCTAVTVEKDGNKVDHEGIDYLKLMASDFLTCKILDVKRKEYSVPGPIVTVKVWSDDRQTEVSTGKRVRAAVNFLKETFTVELPDGEKYQTNELNVPN